MSAAASNVPAPPLLEVRELTVEFKQGKRKPPLRAVDGVSFKVEARQTVGLVGESGSGKTTIGRAILGLTPVMSGSVLFAGADITHADHKQRRRLSAELQVVFQDPYSSLNPTRTIGQTLTEPLLAQGAAGRADADERVRWMLERVGLDGDAVHRYPANFSGGQRQRIAIARALMVRPRLVICDEPVSALDLSVQAQVLNLLQELQEEFEVGYLFVAHDLAVVRHLSHRIIVLYRGRVMEEGDAETVYTRPAHPYTRALLETAPLPDPEAQRGRRAVRRVPQPATFGAVDACPYTSRCRFALDVCRTRRPALERRPDGSLVACHRWHEIADVPQPAAPEPPAGDEGALLRASGPVS